MRTVPELTIKEFADWYADQFSTGDLNASNHYESANYVQGLRDGLSMQNPNYNLAEIDRAIACLRGAGNLATKINEVTHKKLTGLEYSEMRKKASNRS